MANNHPKQNFIWSFNSTSASPVAKNVAGTNGLINKATFLPSIIAKATFIAVIPYVFATSITNGNNP